MPRFFKKAFPIFILLFTVFISRKAFSEEAIKSKYFNTRVYSGIDRLELLKKLDAEYFLRRNVAYFEDKGHPGEDFDALLGETLDAMYLQVCDIIDIHMYSLVIDLDIFPDKNALGRTLSEYSDKSADVPSFYFYDKNKIYISFEDLNPGMVAHEITHAIVTHYFAVPPPMKLQEILCGYSDYSIRKLINKSRDNDR